MPYNLVIGKKAEKFLEKQSSDIYLRLKNKIIPLAQNPRPHGYKALENHDDGFRIRVGDYRILYTIDEKDKAITIFLIDKRGQAYRDL